MAFGALLFVFVFGSNLEASYLFVCLLFRGESPKS